MRIYENFTEAFSEIKRDVAEMGINISTKTMQNKDIIGEEDFETLEIQDYQYKITHPKISEVPATQPWAKMEWEERVYGITGSPVNPGIAWEARTDIWEEFLVPGRVPEDEMQFDYTYSERFNICAKVNAIILRLQRDIYSRQAYINIWGSEDCIDRYPPIRQPCSLGYLLQYRGDALNMMYYMRSCDLSTHFYNDIYLALQLQYYVADAVGVVPGTFGQNIASLHVYKKDVADVF